MMKTLGLDIPISESGVLPGEAYLAETPVLRSHAGTEPDLFLRWNAVPRAAEVIDAVVHLHGFSQQRGEMRLAEKVPRSGLDLSRRARPARTTGRSRRRLRAARTPRRRGASAARVSRGSP